MTKRRHPTPPMPLGNRACRHEHSRELINSQKGNQKTAAAQRDRALILLCFAAALKTEASVDEVADDGN
jgi:hypothetical protein